MDLAKCQRASYAEQVKWLSGIGILAQIKPMRQAGCFPFCRAGRWVYANFPILSGGF